MDKPRKHFVFFILATAECKRFGKLVGFCHRKRDKRAEWNNIDCTDYKKMTLNLFFLVITLLFHILFDSFTIKCVSFDKHMAFLTFLLPLSHSLLPSLLPSILSFLPSSHLSSKFLFLLKSYICKLYLHVI